MNNSQGDLFQKAKNELKHERRTKVVVSAFGALFWFVGALLLIALLIPSAWVLSIFWRWFVMPIDPQAVLSSAGNSGLIFQIPPLGLWQAYGLVLIAMLLRRGGEVIEKKADETKGQYIKRLYGWLFGKTVVHPLLLLLIGWIVRTLFL